MALDILHSSLVSPVNVFAGLGFLVLTTAFIGLLVSRRKGNPLLSALSYPTPPSVKQDQTYVLHFPPSRQPSLVDIPAVKKAIKISAPPPPEVLSRQALPSTKTVDLSKDNQYTPTGFSTQELRALGRFPDYSILSGVRHPEPCGPNFDIHKATFRPARPFRWNYHQTMSILKYEPDWWVELERNYFQTMAARQELLKTHSDHILFHQPGSELACRELMEMLLQFVTKRYPQYFSLEKDDTVFVNRLLKTTTDLTTTHPLRAIFANIPEDYAMVLRNEADGLYYLRAAMVCSSVGWDIGSHRDEPLRAIHKHVPDYAEKMAFSMDRYFSKMPVDQPIERCSWSLEDHAPLFSSPNAMPDWKRSAFDANPGDLRPEHIKLRCDWQTLRRLPLSAAIVFNFKAVFTPLEELRDEPYVPALLHRVLEQGKENLITYKCVDHVKNTAMGALAGWAKEQVDNGVVPADWEVGTLDESPFFPGWEEKWRAKQGF
ncbi:hrq family protein [Pleurostoma richardsiae]|uniref:Hrq family protein n=1 Tax=Pleurostoma richardsiae TaxID=41990 RepID=A0AA38RXT4_9PEZI|nr:hrq family protein [Pleurostoma richardsiae]